VNPSRIGVSEFVRIQAELVIDHHSHQKQLTLPRQTGLFLYDERGNYERNSASRNENGRLPAMKNKCEGYGISLGDSIKKDEALGNEHMI